jgi:threonine aldolase
MLAPLAAWCAEREVHLDHYGDGEMINGFEREVAGRLGFEAARFMPSGKMAQQIALRVWSERAGCDHVGMHPTSHLELHESRGYNHLHRLRATLVGPADRPLRGEHLDAVPERLAALLIELPIREAGGQLPAWDELEALKTAALERGVRLHLDGARLWECGPGYRRELAEICAGFDSCYGVSLNARHHRPSLRNRWLRCDSSKGAHPYFVAAPCQRFRSSQLGTPP